MPTTTALRPSEAYKAEAWLRTPEAQARSSASLRAVLKERGHGAIEELRQALGVSRTSIRNWRPGGQGGLTPDTINQIATAYAAGAAAEPTAPVVSLSNLKLTPAQQELVDELFDLFYSDNDRDAATWLIEHNPAYFRWTTGATAA